MHWFCKPHPSRRTHHLHLVPTNSPRFREELAFRDHLRSHSRAASEYGALKRRLAVEFKHDREAYAAARAPSSGMPSAAARSRAIASDSWVCATASRDLRSAGQPDLHRLRVPHPHESDTATEMSPSPNRGAGPVALPALSCSGDELGTATDPWDESGGRLHRQTRSTSGFQGG
jgi:hypothetical protein